MPIKKSIKVVFIVGPTGAVKTQIAINLAKKIDGEIICCDSMQIYKGLDILTGKPTAGQMSEVPHHLFSIKNLTENFSVAAYRKQALKKMKEIHGRGKIPIFVGGTGLYAQALLDGLFSSPQRDLRLRKKFQGQAAKYGARYLYEKLKKIDPQAANIINANDLRRIVRALEVYSVTGMTISQLKLNTSGGIYKRYPTCILCLYFKNRFLLYGRINQRVERMFSQGVVDEVKKAISIKLSMTASQALGIKHIKDFIKGKHGIERAKELLKLDTRRYAKRQLSWFRRDKRAKWVPLDGYREAINQKNLDFIYKYC